MKPVNANFVNVRANAPAPVVPAKNVKPITVEMPAVVGQMTNVATNTKQDLAKLGAVVSKSKYLVNIGKILIMIGWIAFFMIYGYKMYANEEKKATKDRNRVNMTFGVIYMIMALLWPFITILMEFFH